jgi:predicted RNA-binding Zn-ribbon protein involved in translation (DUF1610 family)
MLTSSGSHARFAWGLLATCPTCGESLIKRYSFLLPLTQLIMQCNIPPSKWFLLQVAASPMPAICQKKMVRAFPSQTSLGVSLVLLLDQPAVLISFVSLSFSFQIWILCNDCGMTSRVQFHILAHKCPGCSSYNTRQTRGGPAACSRVWERAKRKPEANKPCWACV